MRALRQRAHGRERARHRAARGGTLAGFIAVGCGTLDSRERERATRFLAGMARHATVVQRNAKLIEQVRLASDLKSEFVGPSRTSCARR
jgi:hypothetical protein